MILSFKEQFVDKIKRKIKRTTIREDKGNRWNVGRKIQFWKGNPRNVKNNPYHFANGEVIVVQNIRIDSLNKKVYWIDAGIELDIIALSNKEGFDNVQEFWNWFNLDFVGKLIFFKVDEVK